MNKMMKLVPVMLMAVMGTANANDKSDIKDNKTKLADDPTKVITKVGISYGDNFDFEDSNVSFSGSLALDEGRKINARVNSDATEWRLGGSWLLPVGIVNFNFGKNDHSNGASQYNYSVGTFVPLSVFGIKPLGIQIFPMAGYTYNDGESPRCSEGGKCAEAGFTGTPSVENGFYMAESSGSSGYVGAFALRPLSEKVTLIAGGATTYGSKNDKGENFLGFTGGIGMGYAFNKYHSFNVVTYMMDNNTYLDDPDKRVMASYTYQFN